MKSNKIWLACLFFAVILIIVINTIKPGGNKTKYTNDNINIKKVQESNPSRVNKKPNSSSTVKKTAEKNTAKKSNTIQVIKKNQPLPAPKTGQVKNTPNPKAETKTEAEPVVPKEVDDKANSIAKSKVQTGDYVEVIEILKDKLSFSEIEYLFQSARDDYWVKTPVEDIEKARKILFSKLSDDDLSKLKQIGKKYGRSMTIIDKNIDVAEVKEKRMKELGLI